MESNVRWLALGAVIRASGMSLVAPFFFLYLRNVLALGYVDIGLLVAVTGVVPLALAPFAGLLTDRVGRRRVILVSLLVEAGALLLVAPAMQARWLLGILVLVTLVQTVGSIAGPAISAYVADFVSGSDRTTGYTWVRIGWNVGFTLGVLFGGVLIGLLGFIPVALLAGSVLVAGTTFLTVALDPSPYDRGRPSRGGPPASATFLARPGSIRASARRLARDRPFLALCAAVGLASLTLGQWSVTFPLYVNSVLGVPYAVLGIGLSLNGLLVVFGQSATTRASLGHRHTSLLIVGSALYGGSFLLLGASGLLSAAVVPLFFAVVVVLTFGENLGSIPMTTLPSNLAPPSDIGAYNGTFQAIVGVGQVLAPTLGGLVLATGAAPIVVWAALCAPMAPALLVVGLYVEPRLDRTANRA